MELDPVQYFVSKSNGIFLWVALVIQQLSKAKSKKVFETYLNSFSASPGDMNILYANVLSRMDAEDQRWAKEILKRILVSPGSLTVEGLQGVVGESLEDEHDEFRYFLEIQCGSFIRLVSIHGFLVIQLIHDTFRTFLIEPARQCPAKFSIDLDAWNVELLFYYVLILCLQQRPKRDKS